MPTMRTIMLSAVAALLLALPATASAGKVPIRVGLGDQSYTIFDQQKFQDLNIKRLRYFIKWNAIDDDWQLQQADIFVDQARQNGAEVFMTPSSSVLTRKKGKLPSVSQYKRKVGALVRRYKAMGVNEWGVWNEANHDSQPTYKNPKRAAQYFQTMYGLCKGCTIVGLDVLDQRGVESYVARFYKALSPGWRKRAKLVGIHNYSDVNRLRMSGTQDIVRTVRQRGRNPKAKIWLTETGGLVEFGGAWKCNKSRAANRIKYMFSSAKKQRKVIQRLYAYAYWGNDCKERFDAGLVNKDGSARPGYTAFKNGAKSFLR
jgi:hypothetical protein